VFPLDTAPDPELDLAQRHVAHLGGIDPLKVDN
jgi:hypothetical protein